MSEIISQHPVVFFDGVCLLCSFSAKTLLWIDTKHVFRLSHIQGAAAKKYFSELKEVPDSVVLFYNGKFYFCSDAVLKIFMILGGFWKVFAVFYLIPAKFRDPVYNFIARRRYSWFGKKEFCFLPAGEDRRYFLD